MDNGWLAALSACIGVTVAKWGDGRTCSGKLQNTRRAGDCSAGCRRENQRFAKCQYGAVCCASGNELHSTAALLTRPWARAQTDLWRRGAPARLTTPTPPPDDCTDWLMNARTIPC